MSAALLVVVVQEVVCCKRHGWEELGNDGFFEFLRTLPDAIFVSDDEFVFSMSGVVVRESAERRRRGGVARDARG